MVTLMMSVKIFTLGHLKIKVFWNKGYDVIISLHDVTNKILSHGSNHIVDVVMWPKFGNCSISMREVIKKNFSFDGWAWFKSNNLGMPEMSVELL